MRHNQNRRSRGRSRKAPNPLTRSYESNGPDVKVRGTAAHIAEKYGQLARDAQSSGDRVAAENYFQHAEHYNRIVAAAQAQQVQQAAARDQNTDDGEEDRQDAKSGASEQADITQDRDVVAQAEGTGESGDNDRRRRRRPRRGEQQDGGDETAAPVNAEQDAGASNVQDEKDTEPRRRRRKPRAANGQGAEMASDTAEQSPNGEVPPAEVEATAEESVSQDAGADLNGAGDSGAETDADVTAEGKAALAAFPDRPA